MDSLFNTELPLLLKVVVAFGIVLVLLAAVMWIFKRFGGSRVGPSTARGRQPRLAVIDAAAIDSRRRLVLIRRDNVEHLVMIGGPSDVLIEQNIVRAVPVAPPRDAGMPRQPEPAPRPLAEPLPRAPRPEPVARPPRPDLPPRRAAERPSESPPAFPPRVAPELRAARPSPLGTRGLDEPPLREANLSDMAHRLEADLRRARRPVTADPAPPALSEPTPPTAPDINGNSPPARPAAEPPSMAANVKAEAEREPDKKESLLDSLEEEMASLLNKPPETPPEKK